MKFKKLLAILVAAVFALGLVPPKQRLFAETAAPQPTAGEAAEIDSLLAFSAAIGEMDRQYTRKVCDPDDKTFGTARLLVIGEGEPDYSGSIAHVEGYRDRRLIQYASPAEAEKAFERMNNDGSGLLVVPDVIMEADQDPYEYDFMSWGYDYVHTDAYSFGSWLLSRSGGSLPVVTVAVIDTGVMLEHPVFSGRLVNGYDFVNNDSDPHDDNYPTGHGTHVAGTIVDGTFSNVKIMPIKVIDAENWCSSAVVLNGMEYARLNHCSVANMSLGFAYSNNSSVWDNLVSAFTSEINECFSAGTIVCCAAGNASEDSSLHAPGCVARAFTVAAHDANFDLCSFSNYGPGVDIAAPGQAIFSANIALNPALHQLNGTSMACPHVAAACALVRSYAPYYDPDAVIYLVKSAALSAGYANGFGALSISRLVRQLSSDVIPLPAANSQLDSALNYSGYNLSFRSPGSYAFGVQSSDGRTYGVTGNYHIANSTSSVTVGLYMTAGSSLQFDYVYSSEANYDFFDFEVNGENFLHLSGNDSTWRSYSWTSAVTGYLTFTWKYTKDSRTDGGWDGVAIDNVRWSGSVSTLNPPSATPTVGIFAQLSDAVNVSGSNLLFSSMCYYNFVPESSGGRTYARSGNVGVHNTNSVLTLSIYMYSGDTLDYDVRVSSETNKDWYQFYVNGERQQYLTGNQDWHTYRYTASQNGVYTFNWYYTKDASGSSGSDCCMLDNIRYNHGSVSGGSGDINGDGAVSAADAMLALRYSMHLISLNSSQLARGDVNGDGSVTAADAMIILRRSMGLVN